MDIQKIMAQLEAKHPGERVLQAVHEVLISIEDVYNRHPEFERAKLIERLVEPERIIVFRVPWVDDKERFRSTWVIGYSSTVPSARIRADCVSMLP